MSDVASLTEGLKALEDERKSVLEPLKAKEQDLTEQLRAAYQQMLITCGICDKESPMRERRYIEPNWRKGLPEFIIWHTCQMECPECSKVQTIWNHRDVDSISQAFEFGKKYGYKVLAFFSEKSVSYGRLL